MSLNNIIPTLVVCMLALVPFSMVSIDVEMTEIQQPTVRHTVDENASGWLAVGGASCERVRVPWSPCQMEAWWSVECLNKALLLMAMSLVFRATIQTLELISSLAG